MSTHEYHDDPEELAKSQAARYELRDGDYKGVAKIVLGFFVGTAICFPVAYALMLLVSKTMVPRPYAINSVRMDAPRTMPTKAPLQTNTTAHSDMEDLRKHDHVQTETYGNSSINQGKKRVPVDRAIEVLSKEGTSGITGGAN
ncbi:MAG: hypothetical protein JNK63_00665 [Chthonomonas sp.]|nr:hypothetical protein [Chthonomonas sp.]